MIKMTNWIKGENLIACLFCSLRNYSVLILYGHSVVRFNGDNNVIKIREREGRRI